jgi:hypothetical protein
MFESLLSEFEPRYQWLASHTCVPSGHTVLGIMAHSRRGEMHNYSPWMENSTGRQNGINQIN